MLSTEQAKKLRDLIARHAHYQYQAGRLDRRQDHEKRARIEAAADATTRALCAALSALTTEEMEQNEVF
jgi:hypothetical protein